MFNFATDIHNKRQKRYLHLSAQNGYATAYKWMKAANNEISRSACNVRTNYGSGVIMAKEFAY